MREMEFVEQSANVVFVKWPFKGTYSAAATGDEIKVDGKVHKKNPLDEECSYDNVETKM